MAETFTKSMARNIYFGGSIFFILVFLGLAFHTEKQIPKRTNASEMTEAVVRGKMVWETNNCVGCHSLLGEGAYFAPELGNVFKRRSNQDSESFKFYLQAWMQIQPTGTPGRRQMPQFNLTEQQVNDLADFLEWTSKIDTFGWPPNIEG